MNWYTLSVLTLNGFVEEYAEGNTALEAIATIRNEYGLEARSITARKSFYTEWRWMTGREKLGDLAKI